MNIVLILSLLAILFSTISWIFIINTFRILNKKPKLISPVSDGLEFSKKVKNHQVLYVASPFGTLGLIF
jgi:hypothetical protein